MSWPEYFSPQAVRDVEAAVDWLADNADTATARRLARATVAAARRIVDRPQLGRVRPELFPPRFRSWAVQGFPYLLIYDAERRPPQVVRVLHMARDLAALLDDFGENTET